MVIPHNQGKKYFVDILNGGKHILNLKLPINLGPLIDPPNFGPLLKKRVQFFLDLYLCLVKEASEIEKLFLKPV